MLTVKTINRLRKIEQFLIAEPRRFNMGAGVESSEMHRDMLGDPPCGTACCIGGAGYVIGKRIKLAGSIVGWGSIEEFVIPWLGLDWKQVQRLFYMMNWPPEFKQLYEDATTPLQRVAAGIVRIEHFILTNGE